MATNETLAVQGRAARSYKRAFETMTAVDKKHSTYKIANDGFLYIGAADVEEKAHTKLVKAEAFCFRTGLSSKDLYEIEVA